MAKVIADGVGAASCVFRWGRQNALAIEKQVPATVTICLGERGAQAKIVSRLKGNVDRVTRRAVDQGTFVAARAKGFIGKGIAFIDFRAGKRR